MRDEDEILQAVVDAAQRLLRATGSMVDLTDLHEARAEWIVHLTEREKDVIRLLGQGMSNKAIGSALFITERTARTYVSNILGKLGLASRTQAALYAVKHKLVDGSRD